MKKLLALFLTLSMGLLASCNADKSQQQNKSADDNAKKELIVFAAASMTETLEKLADKFMQENNVELKFNFDSSGTLKTQIEEGAKVDVFISAGQKQMDQLDITADKEINKNSLDFVEKDTRFDFLENKVALAVPEGNPKNINSYEDLKHTLEGGSAMLAIGNSDVPVGQYAQKILKSLDIDEEKAANSGSITYATNVKEVTTQVSEGLVDAGIIYQTDAKSAGLTVVDTATKQMCGQVIYPAAVINTSENKELAQKYLDYLKTDEASKVFEEVGFSPIK